MCNYNQKSKIILMNVKPGNLRIKVSALDIFFLPTPVYRCCYQTKQNNKENIKTMKSKRYRKHRKNKEKTTKII